MDSFLVNKTLVLCLYVHAKQRFAMHKDTKMLSK